MALLPGCDLITPLGRLQVVSAVINAGEVSSSAGGPVIGVTGKEAESRATGDFCLGMGEMRMLHSQSWAWSTSPSVRPNSLVLALWEPRPGDFEHEASFFIFIFFFFSLQIQE